MNNKWNGWTYILENFIVLHCSSFVTLQKYYGHINFQIHTANLRVGFIIDNISKNDPDLWATIYSDRLNNKGMSNDFKKISTFLLPMFPYAKHRATNNTDTPNSQIYDVTSKVKCHSNTGVDICWNTKKKYYKLST